MEYLNLKDDEFIGEQFNIFKKTEDYKNYTEMIQSEKPTLSPYLIEIAIFGFFYETLREEMDEILLKKYPSLIELAESKTFTKPEIISEYKGVDIYENEEDYLRKNPNVKPIKTDIENPFTKLE